MGPGDIPEKLLHYVHLVLLNTERGAPLRLDKYDKESQSQRLREDAERLIIEVVRQIMEAILKTGELDQALGIVAREYGLHTFIEAIDGPLERREDLTYIAFGSKEAGDEQET